MSVAVVGTGVLARWWCGGFNSPPLHVMLPPFPHMTPRPSPQATAHPHRQGRLDVRIFGVARRVPLQGRVDAADDGAAGDACVHPGGQGGRRRGLAEAAARGAWNVDRRVGGQLVEVGRFWYHVHRGGRVGRLVEVGRLLLVREGSGTSCALPACSATDG